MNVSKSGKQGGPRATKCDPIVIAFILGVLDFEVAFLLKRLLTSAASQRWMFVASRLLGSQGLWLLDLFS